MRALRLAAVTAAVLTAVLAAPGAAQAATIKQSFAADSGDACRYGHTEGTLGWQYGTASPLPVLAVDVTGKLTDRPLPADPGTACPDDGYVSAATFTAYAGSTLVDRRTVRANNSALYFTFTLENSASTAIDQVVVQVCRSPVSTLPPSYCGKAIHYPAPPVA